MSEHKVEVVKVVITPHPNADAVELAQVGDYLSVVKKGQFSTGDLVAYIPEQSILPTSLIQELGLEGRLAGSAKNRVKAIKLRGVLSQGLCYPAKPEWKSGQDVTELLGVTKYEPPVPTALAGEVFSAGLERCLKYDIENFKRYPDLLQDGEEVVFTEKIHGTWCCIGVLAPEHSHPVYGDVIITSKGLSSQGLAFKLFDAENPERGNPNSNNLYVRTESATNMVQRIKEHCAYYLDQGMSVYVLGEVFGRGVQDLSYGASADHDENIGFRVFDIYVGSPRTPNSRYLDHESLELVTSSLGLKRVPVLYRGPFSKEVLLQYTDGKESVTGKGAHIREGVVVRPVKERRSDLIGRVQLKSVSEHYLLRKDGTEYT